jgi:secondary thiamine-phosphate synthase enzyme
MVTFTGTVMLHTKGFTDVIDITDRVSSVLSESGIQDGLVTVFCSGSTGSVTTIEYEPGVIKDLQRAVERLVPSSSSYDHDRRWGDGNGFSHVRAALLKPSLGIPVSDGRLLLGSWQQIVFIDFDNRSRDRALTVQIIGESGR